MADVIPVRMVNPRFSSLQGNSFWTVAGLTAWDAGHFEFVNDVEGKAYGIVKIPTGYESIAVVLEVGANATSGVTRLQVSTAAIGDGESMNTGSLTAETAQDITVPGTAYYRKKVTFPTSGSIGTSVATDDLLIIEVFHDGDHANDTLAVNTLLWGVWIEVV